MKAAVLLYPGAEELDVFAPFEVLQAARARGAAIETTLVTVDDAIVSMRLAHGAIVVPHAQFTHADLLVIPGGGWGNHAAEGARAEAQNPATLALIHHAAASGATLAGVCTGTMLLAHAGLLRNRPATTHHSAIEDLQASGAGIAEARVVDDGDIVTCGGVTSGLDLALWLVERFFGATFAQETAAYLEYQRRGPLWRDGRLVE